MSETPASRWPTRLALVVGVLESLGAIGWCFGGAGIYGSPLAGKPWDQLILIWAFLLTGPFSALVAALLMWRSDPRLGAGWMLAGALLSALIGLWIFAINKLAVLALLAVSIASGVIISRTDRWAARRILTCLFLLGFFLLSILATDGGILVILAISLPMYLIGRWQWRASAPRQ